MEQILAFGLGIMLVTTIVLVYVVLKSGKQVSKCVEQLRDVQQTFDSVWREINDRENDLHRNIDEVDRKSTRLNSSHIPLSRMPSSA